MINRHSQLASIICLGTIFYTSFPNNPTFADPISTSKVRVCKSTDKEKRERELVKHINNINRMSRKVLFDFEQIEKDVDKFKKRLNDQKEGADVLLNIYSIKSVFVKTLRRKVKEVGDKWNKIEFERTLISESTGTYIGSKVKGWAKTLAKINEVTIALNFSDWLTGYSLEVGESKHSSIDTFAKISKEAGIELRRLRNKCRDKDDEDEANKDKEKDEKDDTPRTPSTLKKQVSPLISEFEWEQVRKLSLHLYACNNGKKGSDIVFSSPVFVREKGCHYIDSYPLARIVIRDVEEIELFYFYHVTGPENVIAFGPRFDKKEEIQVNINNQKIQCRRAGFMCKGEIWGNLAETIRNYLDNQTKR